MVMFRGIGQLGGNLGNIAPITFLVSTQILVFFRIPDLWCQDKIYLPDFNTLLILIILADYQFFMTGWWAADQCQQKIRYKSLLLYSNSQNSWLLLHQSYLPCPYLAMCGLQECRILFWLVQKWFNHTSFYITEKVI